MYSILESHKIMTYRMVLKSLTIMGHQLSGYAHTQKLFLAAMTLWWRGSRILLPGEKTEDKLHMWQ